MGSSPGGSLVVHAAAYEPRIKQAVLLMAGTKDRYMPLHMLPDQLMTLTAAPSVSARVFTEAEAAQHHRQIVNMGLALEVILGWLDETGGREH